MGRGPGFYDITLYYDAKDFTLRQNLVSELYVMFLNGYKPKGTTRISVTLDDDEEDYITGYFGSILSVYAKFDKPGYWKSNAAQQNQFILDTIHRIAILCADKYGWDKPVFESAYQEVLESGFVYKQEQKRKLSKDKMHHASLLLNKDGIMATLSAMFYAKNGQLIKSVELVKTFRHSMFYNVLLKNNKWFNNREFGIHAKNEELIIKASLDYEEAKIIITPGFYSADDLEAYLKDIVYSDIVTVPDLLKGLI